MALILAAVPVRWATVDRPDPSLLGISVSLGAFMLLRVALDLAIDSVAAEAGRDGRADNAAVGPDAARPSLSPYRQAGSADQGTLASSLTIGQDESGTESIDSCRDALRNHDLYVVDNQGE